MKCSSILYVRLILIVTLANLAGCTNTGDKESSDLSVVNKDTGCVTGLDANHPEKRTCYQIGGGNAIADFDINLGPVENLGKLTKTSIINSRSLIVARGLRWPNGDIPYLFHRNIPEGMKKSLIDATKEFNALGVVNFHLVTDESTLPYSAPRVIFQVGGTSGDKCYLPFTAAGTAYVGVGRPNTVCLQSFAETRTILHELGHVLGLYHEQQREDRDKFVDIFVRPGSAQKCGDAAISSGKKTKDAQDVGVYDFSSIMHYDANAYLIPNCAGSGFAAVHIQQRDRLPAGQYIGKMGQGSKRLSAKDKANIIAIYGGSFLDAPDELSLVQATPTSVKLSFMNNAERGNSIGMEYAVGKSNDWTRSPTSIVTGYQAGPGSIRVTNLQGNTEYRFRAFTFNNAGPTPLRSQNSSELTVKTLPRRNAFLLGGNINGIGNIENGIVSTVELTLEVNKDEKALYEPIIQTLTVATNGPFTFPIPIEAGAPYTISFSRVIPEYRICKFASPTFEPMPSANKTNLSANCLNNGYFVEGSVLGLSGIATESVKLSNGTEILDVTRSGKFKFLTRIEYGKTVDLTVSQQPVGRTCIVTLGALTIGLINNKTTVNCSLKNFKIGATVSNLSDEITLSLSPSSTFDSQNEFRISDVLYHNIVSNVPYLSRYNISIKTQPAGHLCTLPEEARSSVPDRDVNIAVSCQKKNYPLNVNVIGLIGGLELENGGVKKTASDYGRYVRVVFENMPHRTGYQVKINSMPRFQTCSSTDAIGAISGKDSLVTINCINHPVELTGIPARGRQDLPYEFTPTISHTGRTRFSIRDAPAWVRFNFETGKISGIPYIGGTYKPVVSVVVDGNFIGSQAFDIIIDEDPLAHDAWHLRNFNQTSFSINRGSYLMDMDIHSLILGTNIPKPLSGSGIRIGFIGEGIETNHEDLSENILLNSSIDYRIDKTPAAIPSLGATQAAGIIAAVGWNNKGSRGIAPGAKLADLNAYAPELAKNQQNLAVSDALRKDFDIIYTNHVDIDPVRSVLFKNLSSEIVSSLDSSVKTGRGGLGTIQIAQASVEYGFTRRIGTAFSAMGNYPQVILAASSNAFGGKSLFSQVGSNIWVTGLGGDAGLNPAKNLTPTSFILPPYIPSLDFFPLRSPGMITTDLSGCESGASKRVDASSSLFNYNSDLNAPHPLNLNCNYSNTVLSQDLGAASVTGVVALLLEANPSLSWRDVKHILAKSTLTSGSRAGETTLNQFQVTGTNINYPDAFNTPYRTNAAGNHFSNSLGFGRVHGRLAVQMATNSYISPFLGRDFISTSNSDGTWRYTSGEINRSLSVPNNGPANLIHVDEDVRIEAVQIALSLEHPHIGNLEIYLVNKTTGTRSNLLSRGGVDPFVNTNSQTTLSDQILLTNAFYEESSRGDWELSINDGTSNSVGNLRHWKINFFGSRNSGN